MMTHDEISRLFSEEDVKKAFQLPDWPAGTEVVCYCRSTDSRDTIEQIAQQRQWTMAVYCTCLGCGAERNSNIVKRTKAI